MGRRGPKVGSPPGFSSHPKRKKSNWSLTLVCARLSDALYTHTSYIQTSGASSFVRVCARACCESVSQQGPFSILFPVLPRNLSAPVQDKREYAEVSSQISKIGKRKPTKTWDKQTVATAQACDNSYDDRTLNDKQMRGENKKRKAVTFVVYPLVPLILHAPLKAAPQNKKEKISLKKKEKEN
ncbi:hypothetical protein B0T24DRAFT_404403 [Lasiosphaeria ovina]|uniref:Uncharacterized protein n=1 Tax=Lasiosphaeria ovina TaxID=92902 RepID=A0AAE0N007_9PEZI|nr:hypothetical protein B0T24DRAFT_404403 [Lasiosphaeria ovina]